MTRQQHLALRHAAIVRGPGNRLTSVDSNDWDGFCRGNLRIQDIAAGMGPDTPEIVELMLLTLRRQSDGSRSGSSDSARIEPASVECVDPLRLSLDEHGFLRRLHIELEAIPEPNVMDLRPRLVAGYLRRVHHWNPSAELIEAALALCLRPR